MSEDKEIIIVGWSYGSVASCEVRLTMSEISWRYGNKDDKPYQLSNHQKKSKFRFPLEKIMLRLTKGEKGIITNSSARLEIIKKNDTENQSDWNKWTFFFDYEQNKELGEFLDQYYTFQKNKIESDRLKEEEETIRVMKLKAEEREKARDYGPAIEIWEELGLIEEAARVRKLKAEMGSVRVAQNVVQGDQITKTEIKDSVLNKSNIGSGEDDKFAKLERLAEMKEKGLIDDDEFKQMKKEILGK
tara:strand:- start:494 stop:1228 length:735 start_codon:yes stop_codon:yes gene_type:complete